jgi:5-methylcytosine-specific restriction endonuclease McrA
VTLAKRSFRGCAVAGTIKQVWLWVRNFWARLMQAQNDGLSREAAEFLLAIGFEEKRPPTNVAIGGVVGGRNVDVRRADRVRRLSACREPVGRHAIQGPACSQNEATGPPSLVNQEVVREVRRRAQGRCEYCHLPARAYRLPFHVDHIVARPHGGQTVRENLALAYLRCNRRKGPNIAGTEPTTGKLILRFHPRVDPWSDHSE